MAKIENDKYYTNPSLAEYCVVKTKQIIGFENISEFIEPSGGNGIFLNYLPPSTYSCDIEPMDERIAKQDYLSLDIPYKLHRCIIGNPPFGEKMQLAIDFMRKSTIIADYIAFILPISQLNNNRHIDFSLLYSEDLGLRFFSDKKLHCCFNIYKRNVDNVFNVKSTTKLKDIKIIRQDSKSYSSTKEYDIRMCYWGSGSVGKILTDSSQHFAGEYKIIIKNEKLKEKIKDFIIKYDWKSYCNSIAMKRLKQWEFIKIIKDNFPEIS